MRSGPWNSVVDSKRGFIRCAEKVATLSRACGEEEHRSKQEQESAGRMGTGFHCSDQALWFSPVSISEPAPLHKPKIPEHESECARRFARTAPRAFARVRV